MKKQIALLMFASFFSGICAKTDFIVHEQVKKLPIDIIIPAYNEQDRIGAMLQSYGDYFKGFNVHFIVVFNGITDDTEAIVKKMQQRYPGRITTMTSLKGKGNAIKKGFEAAVKRKSHYIGFTDADGATAPDQYYKLLCNLYDQPLPCSVAVASRHMKDSIVTRPPSFLKDVGRKFFFNRKVRKKLKIDYADYQCGAKVFTADLMRKIVPHISEEGWAIDLDLLYLTKLAGYIGIEIAIKWVDKPGSHLDIFTSGKDVCGAIGRLEKKRVTF